MSYEQLKIRHPIKWVLVLCETFLSERPRGMEYGISTYQPYHEAAR